MGLVPGGVKVMGGWSTGLQGILSRGRGLPGLQSTVQNGPDEEEGKLCAQVAWLQRSHSAPSPCAH